jgi:hypothetical protein
MSAVRAVTRDAPRRVGTLACGSSRRVNGPERSGAAARRGGRHARVWAWVRPHGLAGAVGDPSSGLWWPDQAEAEERAEAWAWLRRGREVLSFDESED